MWKLNLVQKKTVCRNSTCRRIIALLGLYPEETIIEKDTCTPVFTAALFTTARTGKQPSCP